MPSRYEFAPPKHYIKCCIPSLALSLCVYGLWLVGANPFCNVHAPRAQCHEHTPTLDLLFRNVFFFFSIYTEFEDQIGSTCERHIFQAAVRTPNPGIKNNLLN